MPEFAEFTDDSGDLDPLPVLVSALANEDVRACATLAAAREDEPMDRWIGAFQRALEDDRQLVLVARSGSDLVGYGKASWLQLPADCNAPSGWYLTGVVVDPAVRRRGVGRLLTRARLIELRRRGVRQVWYFANALNQASLALHAHLGFGEITRDFAIPGVTFSGGQGALACWDAASN